MPITKDEIKGFLRNARDGGCSSAWGYLRSPEIWRLMPRLTHRLQFEDFEIHVLAGQSRLTMALWMIASWITTTGRHWKFVIHDDGTLGPMDVVRLEHALAHCKVILSKDSNSAVGQALSKYPLCLRCRNLHPLGRKLFDMPLFAIQNKLLSIDTDILFFSTPQLMLQWIIGEDNGKSIFMEDVKDASLVPALEAEQLFEINLVQKVNTGIIGIQKQILSLDFLEECLACSGILNKDRWYIEQTLFALASSKFSNVELLPPGYVMAMDAQCPADAVARHYVGAVRHLFYSEGLAQVRPMLNCNRSRA